jgi:hypothetical protein
MDVKGYVVCFVFVDVPLAGVSPKVHVAGLAQRNDLVHVACVEVVRGALLE